MAAQACVVVEPVSGAGLGLAGALGAVEAGAVAVAVGGAGVSVARRVGISVADVGISVADAVSVALSRSVAVGLAGVAITSGLCFGVPVAVAVDACSVGCEATEDAAGGEVAVDVAALSPPLALPATCCVGPCDERRRA